MPKKKEDLSQPKQEAPKQDDHPPKSADQEIREIVTEKKNEVEARWRPLVRMFGKKGHMVAGESKFKPESIQEYDSIELPIPDGLTEDMVALIAMGVAMDRSKLNKPMTSSTPAHGVTLAEWNAGFISSDLLKGDNRSMGFSEHLVESRKLAKQILEDYQNNKPEGIKAVQKSIQNIMQSSMMDFAYMDPRTLGCPEHGLPAVLKKMSKVPKLGLSLPKVIEPKLTSHLVRMEACDQAIAAFEEIAKTKPAPNTPERERLIAEFLFEHAVFCEGVNSRPDVKKAINEEIKNQITDEYREITGIPMPKEELRNKRADQFYKIVRANIENIDEDDSIESYLTGHICMELETPAIQAYMKCHLTPGELALSEPDGKEKLRTLYMEDIKKSDVFKAMVSEPDMLKLTQKMDQHITKSGICFATYSTKTVPVQDPSKLTIKHFEQEYQNAKQACRHGYDVLFSPKIILDTCKEAMDGLDANWAVHKNSKELSALKASVKKLQGSYNEQVPFAKEITEEQREALMDALRASITYQDTKRREAKASTDPMDDFEPKTTAGKERMRGAQAIEDLAMRMLFDNDKNKMLTFKINYVREIEMQKAQIKSSSDIGKILKDSMKAVSDKAKKHDPKATAQNLASELAAVMAANTIGKAYPNGTGMSDDDLAFKVKASSQEIMEREDFKRMVSTLTVKKAAQLAAEKNGDLLIAELAKHTKQLCAEEKRPKAEPDKNANRVRENDQRKLGG